VQTLLDENLYRVALSDNSGTVVPSPAHRAWTLVRTCHRMDRALSSSRIARGPERSGRWTSMVRTPARSPTSTSTLNAPSGRLMVGRLPSRHRPRGPPLTRHFCHERGCRRPATADVGHLPRHVGELVGGRTLGLLRRNLLAEHPGLAAAGNRFLQFRDGACHPGGDATWKLRLRQRILGIARPIGCRKTIAITANNARTYMASVLPEPPSGQT
jgi:hypothetical protein